MRISPVTAADDFFISFLMDGFYSMETVEQNTVLSGITSAGSCYQPRGI